jgi:hypothetical protein
MWRRSLCGLIAGVFLSLFNDAKSASAEIVDVLVTGTVSSSAGSSADYTGVFGPPGANLAGDAYSILYVFDTTKGQTVQSSDLNYALGGLQHFGPSVESPALSAVLTVNGQSIYWRPVLLGRDLWNGVTKLH